MNVSTLIYFFCGCNVNSAHRNLFRCLLCYVVLKYFLSNLLVFLYSVFKCQKFIKAGRFKKKNIQNISPFLIGSNPPAYSP